MNKKLITMAVAAAVAAPMTVMADATIYGVAKVATQYTDRSQGANDGWAMEDHSSRLGIKGSEDLGGGLKAIYKMEFGVKTGNGAANLNSGAANGAFWSQRNTYVGLAGDWGTFLAGVHDTPLKMSNGKLDFFADSAADYDGSAGQGVALLRSRRVGGALAYVSPSFSGFTVAGALVQADTATSTALGADFQEAYSLAAMYDNGPWFASLAYENLDSDVTTGPEDESQWRAGLGMLGMSNFSVALNYEERNDINGVDNMDSRAWQIQAAYDFGNNRVKAMYGDYDDKPAVGDGTDFDAWAIGLQHNFSKRTNAQVLYRAKNVDNASDENVFALQMDHNF